MENRWSQRTPLELNILIQYGPLGLICGRSKDVSPKGMLIDTGRITLMPDETVEVTFSYPGKLDAKTVSLPAQVVHCSDKGVGVEFINQQLDEFKPNETVPLKKVASC